MPDMTSSAADVEEFSIGQLAERTGVAPATLRMWEKRHGFPEANRRDSGHRRYTEADVRAVVDVLRRREAGVRLDVAIEQVRGGGAATREQRAGSPSVFADLRRRHPSLHVHRLRKTTLLAMSWAIEDEFCAKADRAALFGGFQRSRFWRPARERWTDLARVASATYVMGEFGPGERMVPGVEIVHLGPDSPMRREWAVVCDAPDLPVAMTAWELPGQAAVADAARVFECLWTVDPVVVRDAARTCAAVAAAADAPGAASLVSELEARPAGEGIDTVSVTAMFNRMVAYVDTVGTARHGRQQATPRLR